ncbi:MAG: response regulator [Deltaproteobacteria bacterium]|nr:response regulator [Deltaproteobacteria bacterium]
MDSSANNTNLPRILLVDDETAIRRFLKTVLASGEFRVHEAENGSLALAAAAANRPDLILLDLGLPDMDGVEVIKRLREWSKVPIIVLSVREREDDKVRALDAGGEVQLTPTEYDLLRLLATHAGRVLTHRQILGRIWGAAYLEQPHVLRVNISNLRHKIEKDSSRPRYILTEAGVGYRLRADY